MVRRSTRPVRLLARPAPRAGARATHVHRKRVSPLRSHGRAMRQTPAAALSQKANSMRGFVIFSRSLCMRFKTLTSAAALAVAFALPAHAQTEIQWWHAMTAVNNEWVNDLAKQFNE